MEKLCSLGQRDKYRYVSISSLLLSMINAANTTFQDRPLTDLHETEGDGGFPGAHFMARPVVGGHFAYLTLERACGGKALEGLAFLNKKDPQQSAVESSSSLQDEL